MKRCIHSGRYFLSITTFLIITSASMNGQRLHLGLFTDPLVGWYHSDSEAIEGGGIRAGYAAGLAVNWYLSQNYAFSTGLTYLHTGGVQSSADTTTFLFTNFNTDLLPGEKAVYSTSYLIVPVGMRLRSNQIGYFSIFSDFGLDPGFLSRGTISLPSENIENETANKELTRFNLGFHIHAGAEYSLGGTTSLIFGVGYEQGLTDVTKDNNTQVNDKTFPKLIRFRFGIFF